LKNYKATYLFCLISLSAFYVNAEPLLDDSTVLIYGPTSTEYYYLEDIIQNNNTPRTVDTTIYSIHENKYIYGNKDQQYINLGNYSSARSGIYYQAPKKLGRQLGITIFDPYAFDLDNIKYYDTKSPYTDVQFEQTSTGQQVLDVSFSRNATSLFNIGFVYRKISTLKQIGLPNDGEKYAEPLILQLESSYKSKNGRYTSLFSIGHLYHYVLENGGIRQENNAQVDDYFDYELEEVYLNDVDVHEKRHDFHFYHQYAVEGNNKLQLFHQFDNYRRFNKYADFNFQRNIEYYDLKGFGTTDTVFSFGDTITSSTVELVKDRVIYNNYENKAGIKGSFENFYYQAYLRHRYFYYKVHGKEFNTDQRFMEQFIGGQFRADLTDDFTFDGKAEFSIGNDYSINPSIRYKKSKVALHLMNYSPTLLQQRYRSILFDWDNNFRNTNLVQLNASTEIGNETVKLRPSFELSNIKRYVYFDQSALPAQENANIQIFSPVLGYQVNWLIFHLDGFFKYYYTSNEQLIRSPKWLWQNRAYLESRIFKKKLVFRLGIDIKRQSAYRANEYTPVTQLFFLQDDFVIPSYWNADVFFNFKIKSARIFLRSHNVFADILGNDKGYFASPYYSGLRTSFDFGVKWYLFD